ncbi:MAG: GGDEF domain-containing protein [Spirochaetes bacterium]|nr:GGDEF domain-containing protein [Spirochaetota bacterium]
MSLHEEKVALLRKSEIFSNLREYELDMLANYSEFIPVKKGQMVFHQGARPKSMYVIHRGRVGIISLEENEVMIATKISGDSFGELDLLGMSQRNDSAIVEENGILLRFPANGLSFENILKEKPYLSSLILQRILRAIAVKLWNVQNALTAKANWIHELRKQLLYDKMSGLYNRNFFQEDFIRMLPTSEKSIALLMIKPDNFKSINDTYGHKAGDLTLKLIAIFLVSELGEKDIGIRYGGDEFAAILFDVDVNTAIARAKEIQNALETLTLSHILGNDEKIKVSIGIALYPEQAQEGMHLVAEAHRKLYKARSFGRSIVI